jgi:TolB protein
MRGTRRRSRGGVAWAALGLLALGAWAAPASAQDPEDRFPGVQLGLTYESRTPPAIGIQPFQGRMGGAGAAARAEGIVARDLRLSNRFQVLDSIPQAMVREEVDYSLWDQLGATWLVSGRVEGAGSGSVLIVELHDVIYREVRERRRFSLPEPNHADFRMAVHRVSDAVVEWVHGEPGVAATRIVFSRQMDDGTQDLWVVDYDGENLRRLTRHRPADGAHAITMSPAWSPDGRRIAFTSYKDDGMPRVYELNLATGQERRVPTARTGDYITPAYHPDGERLYFAVTGGHLGGIYSYNIVRQCCFETIMEGRSDDISPAFGPDGRRFVFNSNRLGENAPQIYLAGSDGDRPQILSPYTYGRPGFYNSPDWSPVGDRVAFHGRLERIGMHQILVAELQRRNRLVQLTFDGNNQDPSWAPDGRHLVYVGDRSWGRGLFITDAMTGNTRTLVSGMRVRLPAWSPPLGHLVAGDR